MKPNLNGYGQRGAGVNETLTSSSPAAQIVPSSSPKQYHYLQGPVSLSQHFSSKYGGKMVYIFGDLHMRAQPCSPLDTSSTIGIDHFLKVICEENPDKIIDIFLEFKFVHKKDPTRTEVDFNQGYLFGDVHQTWKNCLQVDKTLCNVSNVRMHYVDPRLHSYINNAETQVVDVLDLLWRTLKNKYDVGTPFDLDDQDEWNRYIGDLETAVKELPTIAQIWTVSKIDKQIQAISEPSVRQAIEGFAQTHFVTCRPTIDSVGYRQLFTLLKQLDFTKPVSNSYATQLYEFIIPLQRHIADWTVSIMDIYLLARMFRSFSNNLVEKSDPPKYIIIYAGNLHSANYRSFLKDILGFETLVDMFPSRKEFNELISRGELNTEKYKSTIIQCVDISGIFQPFFQDSRSQSITKKIVPVTKGNGGGPPLPVFGAVEGPFRLTQHFSKKYGKMVYIFGDVHIRTGQTCPPAYGKSVHISNFIRSTVEVNPDKMIDVFLEMKLLSEKLGEYEGVEVAPHKGYLFGDVRQQWDVCLRLKKDFCVIQNLRMHYADPRTTKLLNLYQGIIWYLVEFKNLLPSSDESKRQQLNTMLMELYVEIDKLEALENANGGPMNFYKHLLHELKVTKQLAAIPNKMVKQSIEREFVDAIWLNPAKQWPAARIRQVVNIHTQNPPLKTEWIGLTESSILEWYNDFMDIYLMARMFRQFTRTELAAGTVSQSQYTEEPRFIIIYAGNWHSVKYRQFLNHVLGFEQIATVGDDDKYDQCVSCLWLRSHNLSFRMRVPDLLLRLIFDRHFHHPVIQLLKLDDKNGKLNIDKLNKT